MKKLTKLNNNPLVKQLATIAAIFISRMGFLPPNFSPLGSFGFMGGNMILYFASIIIFDKFIGGTYLGNWFTYAGFAAYPLANLVAHKVFGGSIRSRLVLLPTASFAFFALSNLGVWWHFYPHTLAGLVLCYTFALPFYTRTFFSDLIFGYSAILLANFANLKESLKSLNNSASRRRVLGDASISSVTSEGTT